MLLFETECLRKKNKYSILRMNELILTDKNSEFVIIYVFGNLLLLVCFKTNLQHPIA